QFFQFIGSVTLFNREKKGIEHGSVGLRENFFRFGRQLVGQVRFPKTAPLAFLAYQAIALQARQMRANGVVRDAERRNEFRDRPRPVAKQENDLTSGAVKEATG